MMAVLDGTIANVALPTIARELHATPANSIWVVNGFQIATAATLLVFASLGSRWGLERIYRIGVALFVIGSLACALSPTLPLLIAARVFQGIGAAGIMAIGPALFRFIFPAAQLGRGLGYNALVVAGSAAAGPTIGGAILAVAPWPWLFAINVPIGLVVLAASLRTLPPIPSRRRGGFDYLGAVTSGAALALFVVAIDSIGTGNAKLTELTFVLALAAAAAFVMRELNADDPLIALDVFRIPAFSLSTITSVASFTAQGLAFVALPYLFQEAMGRSPLQAGLLFTPWPLAVAFAAPFAGRLADKYPAGILGSAGLVVYGIGLAAFATMPAQPSALDIIWRGAVCGLGFGFFQSPNNRELMSSAPREKSATASGILATVRVTGQTLGAAIVAVIFALIGVTLVGPDPTTAATATIVHAARITCWIASGVVAAGLVSSLLRLRS